MTQTNIRHREDQRHCPTCGNRDETANHIGRCAATTRARTEAESHGAAQGIPTVTTADLWAHLGHVAMPQDATRIVRQVVDLGWRPVVGSDPRRLMPTANDRHATTEVAEPEESE